jgi:hypothetical protein
LVFGLGALVLPSVARTRIDGRGEEDVSSVVSMRGFWVRKTEPRAFWEVLDRRSVREEKNCGL